MKQATFITSDSAVQNQYDSLSLLYCYQFQSDDRKIRQKIVYVEDALSFGWFPVGLI